MLPEGALSRRHHERSEGGGGRLRRLMPVEGALSPNNSRDVDAI